MSRPQFAARRAGQQRDKIGSKPGLFPALHPVNRNASPLFGGKSRRVSGGYVQAAYLMLATAPVHRGKDGKLYNAVFHKWSTGNVSKPRGSSTTFDKGCTSIQPPTEGSFSRKMARSLTLNVDLNETGGKLANT